jgi:hypothetical protein
MSSLRSADHICVELSRYESQSVFLKIPQIITLVRNVIPTTGFYENYSKRFADLKSTWQNASK